MVSAGGDISVDRAEGVGEVRGEFLGLERVEEIAFLAGDLEGGLEIAA